VPVSAVIERSEVTGVYVMTPMVKYRFGTFVPVTALATNSRSSQVSRPASVSRSTDGRQRPSRCSRTSIVSRPLGLSGRLARFFLENQLTPLLH